MEVEVAQLVPSLDGQTTTGARRGQPTDEENGCNEDDRGKQAGAHGCTSYFRAARLRRTWLVYGSPKPTLA